MGIIRVILAFLVVFDHTKYIQFFSLPDGIFAVKVFFIISGFYMTLILSRKYVGKGSYSLFISNRFLRLYPIYWVIVGLTIIASFSTFLIYGHWLRLMPLVSYNDFMSLPTLAFISFTNFLLFGQDVAMFLGLNLETGSMFFTNNFLNTFPPFHNFLLVPQAWTIGMELLFYLIAPLIVRKNIKIILILIAFSSLIRCYIYFVLGLQNDPWTYRFFPNELALFLIGTISYHIYDYFEKSPINQYYHKIIFGTYFFIMVIFNYLPKISNEFDINSVFFYILTGLSIPSIFILTKYSKLDNRIGDFSYPIYLVHILVIQIIDLIIDRYHFTFNKVTFVVIITIIISYGLLRYISDPIERFRQRRVKT